MKASVAQINTTPGDFRGNTDKIFTGVRKAADKKSDLVVFPEMTICGYAVKDMMYGKDFVKTNLEYLNEVVNFSNTVARHMHVVVGYVDANTSGSGKPFRNMAAVIRDGLVIATYQKQLLPFYDVFDEGRYFEPGNTPCVIDIKGMRVGLTICEDLWNDKGEDNYNYRTNPLQKYREMGVKTLVNLSSSPYHRGKPQHRRLMFKRIVADGFIKNLIYANQYGAQDELVFDGNSTIIRGSSCVKINNDLFPAPLDEVKVTTVDMRERSYVPCPPTMLEEKEHLAMTLLGLHDYAKKIGIKSFVVGSSGGIDSAVVIALAAMAFGGESVHAIKMPSKWSSDHSVNDAVQLHQAFEVNDYTVQIDHDPWLNAMNNQLGLCAAVGVEDGDDPQSDYVWKDLVDYNKVADENIQARQRGQVVMHFSNATGALLLTTGNKTELSLGYCTLGGDMLGGFNPIGDLYKLEVYEIAKLINAIYGKEMIPNNIISKAPSAELAPGQTDEASLLPYPILDPIIKAYIEDYVDDINDFRHECKNGDVRKWTREEGSKEKYDSMIRRVDMMEYKRRQAAPCTRLTKKAFGTGRRMPIVKK